MSHAKYMQTPVGQVEIPPWFIEKHKKMSDREIVEEAINNGTPFVNPTAFAELLHRGLGANGTTREAIYETLEQREKDK